MTYDRTSKQSKTNRLTIVNDLVLRIRIGWIRNIFTSWIRIRKNTRKRTIIKKSSVKKIWKSWRKVNDLNPDPHQNKMDPKHCRYYNVAYRKRLFTWKTGLPAGWSADSTSRRSSHSRTAATGYWYTRHTWKVSMLMRMSSVATPLSASKGYP